MELLTPRLRLREFRADDFDVLYEMDSNPEFVRYERPVRTPEQVRDRLELVLKDQEKDPRTHYRFAITLPPASALRGHVALTRINLEAREYEIGWSIHPVEWGKGYATEAARRVLAFAFTELGAHRVTAFCHADNAASERVMQKLGMTRECLIREVRWLNGEWWDELVYAILEQEFREKYGPKGYRP